MAAATSAVGGRTNAIIDARVADQYAVGWRRAVDPKCPGTAQFARHEERGAETDRHGVREDERYPENSGTRMRQRRQIVDGSRQPRNHQRRAERRVDGNQFLLCAAPRERQQDELGGRLRDRVACGDQSGEGPAEPDTGKCAD